MSLYKTLEKHSLGIGIIAMLLLIAGTIVGGGSLLQRLLFVVGVPILGLTAYFNKQNMFAILQLVATIGAILAFFSGILPPILNSIIMLGSGIIGIGYLIKTKYPKKDRYWLTGSLGLLCIAGGFATDAITHPILFNSLLGVGGILVIIYSALGFFVLKNRIYLLWLILNIVFIINPLRIVFSQFF